MSFKAGFIKMAIKCTPKTMVMWVANMIFKGIVEMNDYDIDLDTRKIYVKTTLHGEAEPIEVWIDGFAIHDDEGTKNFVVEQATANRKWLSNILRFVTGRRWQIPHVPKYQAHMDLIEELLKAEQAEKVKIEDASE